ncbi:MAG: HAD-IA family hydrolase [Deltaproteobacteria bacterium]|nr:HAD-IA family hydrolase [Deltaproteobacteria bacterium]
MNSLFLFDFDGVLVDSLDLYAEAVTRCLVRIGTPIVQSREDYLDLFDGNFYESMAARGVDLAAFSRAAKEIMPGINYAAMQPYAGLIPVLSALQESHLLTVVSSNGKKAIQALLDRFGFAPYFREILGSDFLLSKKDKIDFAVDNYGISREKTVYIGDTAGDIVEARAAGVRAAAVTWGWHSRERLLAVDPDFLIDRPEELLAIAAATAGETSKS